MPYFTASDALRKLSDRNFVRINSHLPPRQLLLPGQATFSLNTLFQHLIRHAVFHRIRRAQEVIRSEFCANKFAPTPPPTASPRTSHIFLKHAFPAPDPPCRISPHPTRSGSYRGPYRARSFQPLARG